ncbi:glycosyltransferase family 4 protein [Acidocella sp.]|uniref:glycosyltransferase family 4 protein n=1 Tax=Acidocella sp. TaxID=50710 RepID=UPI002634EB22|nr:glycosyltransferase family 4 protein [Acidocella sp.]
MKDAIGAQGVKDAIGAQGVNMAPARGRVLVFVVTVDWFFASHFLARALAARAAGWRVVVVAREGPAAARIRALGIELVPVAFERASLDPLAHMRLVWRLSGLYRALRPDLVHHVAMKPILLGGLAARLAGVRAVVNAPVGLGFVFSSSGGLARRLRPLVRAWLRVTLTPPNAVAVFETEADRYEMLRAGLAAPGRVRVIAGAGVDGGRFVPSAPPGGRVRVVMAARLLRAKGVELFAEAAGRLRGRAEFWLAGAPDAGNPDSLRADEVAALADAQGVRWLGEVADMPGLLAGAHIVCLPSYYGEGLPKILLEAMACGRAVVASDIAGCRAALGDEAGLLVAPRDAEALCAALARLIEDAPLRARLGQAGRARVEAAFLDEHICARTLALYDELTVLGEGR